ncbi:MAG: HNH endonuclease [Deltaproteobacteria bacterium]|nr:HNH endonuclease [Deltaproteobacteria bacterium]
MRSQVRLRAQERCEYCHLPEEADFAFHEVDHIIAGQHGGLTELANLAYACFDCNRCKGPNLTSIDPQTNEIAILFNPRTQEWNDHFELNVDGTVNGCTTTGRATARLLKFNDPGRVQDRVGLIAVGKLNPKPTRH